MRRFTFFFVALLLMVGVTAKADPGDYTVNFNGLTALPEGWEAVETTVGFSYGAGTYEIGSDYARSGKGLYTYQTSYAGYIVTAPVTGDVSFYVRARATRKACGVKVFKYDGGVGEEITAAAKSYTSSNTSTTWTQITFTLDAGTRLAFQLNNAAIDDFVAEAYVAADGPQLVVKDGSKVTSPYSYNFGLVTAGTEKVFTLSNPGTEDLGISVSETGSFGATLSASTIAAGSEVTLTVTMPDATSSSAVTITPDAASGIDPFVINLSGTIRDANKVYEYGFTALPEDWTTNGTWYYSEANGAYNTSWYLSSNARLITPLLNISDGEEFFVEAKGYSTSNTSYQHLQMQYSADGTTWTNFDSEPTLDPSAWNTFRFTGVPAGKYYIAINVSQADIRMFYGGELPTEPRLSVSPTAYDFGAITATTTSEAITISNTGRADLENLSVVSDNADFTVSVADGATSIAAGAAATFTVTMSAAATGAKSATITISGDGVDDVTVAVSGVVIPDDLFVVDFNDNALPAGWTNSSWSFADGAATGRSSSAYLTTPKLQFADGDILVIKAKRYDSDTTDYLTVQGSSDNGATWTAYSKQLRSADGLTYPDYGTLIISDIPSTVNKIRFVGYYVTVDEIAGLTYAPELAVTKDGAAVTSPASYDFGEISADATVTYNFANSGAGTLNITGVAISGDGAAAYSTSWTASVATPYDLVVTRNYDATRTEQQDATITVTTSEGDFVINVTGTDKAANAPELTVTPAEDAAFGAVTAATSKTYTVTNSGTGVLAVDIASDDAMFTVSDAQLTEIAAGESKTFDVVFTPVAETYGTFTANIIVTPTYDATAAVTIAASAKVKDPNVWSEDFSSDAMPEGWETTSTSYWTVADGVAKGTYSYTAYYLTTPSLTVSGTDDAMTFDYAATANYVSVTIQMSKDGADWVTCTPATAIGTLNNGDSGTATITGLEAGNYRFRFKADDYNLDNFEGFKLNENDPKLEVYADAALTESVATGTTKDFGWVNADATATYYIKNSGTGTLTIISTEGAEGFTITDVTDANRDITTDALAFDVTLSASAEGNKAGTITLTTNVGDFTIPVKGFVYGDRNLVDFTTATSFPTGWNVDSWTVSGGAANAPYGDSDIETPVMTANAAEKLYVEAKAGSWSPSLTYAYSTDNGATWTDGAAAVISDGASTDFAVYEIDDIADASAERQVIIRFTGKNVSISRIYGFLETGLILSETVSYSNTLEGVRDVTLNRPFIAGWNTLVLPFDVEAGDLDKFGAGAEFFEFTSNNGGELTFSPVSGKLVAGTPYMLNLLAAISESLVFNAANIVTTVNDVEIDGASFKGNYANGMNMGGKYGVTPAGKVQKGSASSSMKAFRAYIEIADGVSPSIRVYDPTTGISRVLSKEQTGQMFNLKGQRVNANERDVVIVNGKKVIR